MIASQRSTIVLGHRASTSVRTVAAMRRYLARPLRQAGTAVGRSTARAAAHARRPLSTRQLFAVVFVLLVLLYLFVLLVEPTGAGRGGR